MLGALWMGAGRSAGWFKEGARISACALKKETGGVLGRGSRLAVARPGEAGKTGLTHGVGLSVRERSGTRASAAERWAAGSSERWAAGSSERVRGLGQRGAMRRSRTGPRATLGEGVGGFCGSGPCVWAAGLAPGRERAARFGLGKRKVGHGPLRGLVG